jgi:hypothetical protein
MLTIITSIIIFLFWLYSDAYVPYDNILVPSSLNASIKVYHFFAKYGFITYPNGIVEYHIGIGNTWYKIWTRIPNGTSYDDLML